MAAKAAKAPAPLVGASLAALTEALQAEVVIPENNGVPALLLVAPTGREIRPAAVAFRSAMEAAAKANAAFAVRKNPTPEEVAENGNLFADAIEIGAVGALIACVRDPEDPDARITEPEAQIILDRHGDSPTPENAWRTAMRLSRLMDLDEYDRQVALAAKKANAGKAVAGKKKATRRRGSAGAAAPVVDFPTSGSSPK